MQEPNKILFGLGYYPYNGDSLFVIERYPISSTQSTKQAEQQLFDSLKERQQSHYVFSKLQQEPFLHLL